MICVTKVIKNLSPASIWDCFFHIFIYIMYMHLANYT